jgi:hypothetical protein
VAPLPQQSEPRRLLVAYGLEVLLAQLEAAFAERGIWLGRITSESLALLPAVGEVLGDAALGALAVVRQGGYTLLFSRRGEPVLYRFKSLDDNQGGVGAASGASGGPAGAAVQRGVERDLRLTRAFVAEQLPELAIERVVMAAGADVSRDWQGWISAGLGRPGEPLESLRLPLAAAERVGWMEVAPMLGAARQEVT